MYQAILVTILTVVLLGNNISCPSDIIDSQTKNFSDNDHLVSIEPGRILDCKDGIIYFGKDTCPQCIELEKYLIKCLDSMNHRFTIYYFNTNLWRDDALFDRVLEEYHVYGVLYIIYIKDGLICEVLKISDLDDQETSMKEIMDFFKRNAG